MFSVETCFIFKAEGNKYIDFPRKHFFECCDLLYALMFYSLLDLQVM